MGRGWARWLWFCALGLLRLGLVGVVALSVLCVFRVWFWVVGYVVGTGCRGQLIGSAGGYRDGEVLVDKCLCFLSTSSDRGGEASALIAHLMIRTCLSDVSLPAPACNQ